RLLRAVVLYLSIERALRGSVLAATGTWTGDQQPLFAPSPRMEWRMRNQAAKTDVILNAIARPKTRSSLFWWLFDNHSAIAQRAEGRRFDWTELCTTFRDQGLTDLDGKAPTVRTARMTWWRVRKEHARIEALRAAERADRERRPATTVEQASRGFQLSTAEGVVVTRVGRVFKTEEATQDYVFDEDGMIVGG